MPIKVISFGVIKYIDQGLFWGYGDIKYCQQVMIIIIIIIIKVIK